VIVLERACPADFDFLGLDRLDPPKKRHATRQEEDDFARRSLLLRGKWWDSPARHALFIEPDHLQDEEVMAAQPEPTARENAWVGAAWPGSGGLVVAEWPTMMYPGGRMDEVAPDDVSRLFLCMTMDKKAAVLMDTNVAKRGREPESWRQSSAWFMRSLIQKIKAKHRDSLSISAPLVARYVIQRSILLL
jgi:hypothetical protein